MNEWVSKWMVWTSPAGPGSGEWAMWISTVMVRSGFVAWLVPKPSSGIPEAGEGKGLGEGPWERWTRKCNTTHQCQCAVRSWHLFLFFWATSSESRALRAHIIFSSTPEAEESLSMGLTGQDRLRFPEELCFSVSCALNQSGKPVSGKPELYWPSTAVAHGHLKKKKKKKKTMNESAIFNSWKISL